MTWARFFKNTKDTINSIVSSVSATAGGTIITGITRPLSYCYPQVSDPCNIKLEKINSYASLGFAWGDHIIGWFPRIHRLAQYRFTNSLTKLWNNITDINMMWNFFLSFWLALYVEINGKDKDMDNFREFLPAVLVTFVASILTNPSVRSWIWNKCFGVNGNRGIPAELWDMISEMFRQFANVRQLVQVCEAMHDAINETNVGTYSLAGRVTRYVLGGAWGLVGAITGLLYKPDANILQQIFPDATQNPIRRATNIADTIFSLTSFAILTTTAIKDTPSPHQEALITGFSVLIAASIAQNCCAPALAGPGYAALRAGNDDNDANDAKGQPGEKREKPLLTPGGSP